MHKLQLTCFKKMLPFLNISLNGGQMNKIQNLRVKQIHNHSDDFNEGNYQLENDTRDT